MARIDVAPENPLNTNNPPPERAEPSAADRRELQHEAWSADGQTDTWNRQQRSWSQAEGSERGQPEFRTQAPEGGTSGTYRGQERWDPPQDLDNRDQPEVGAEQRDDTSAVRQRSDAQLLREVTARLRDHAIDMRAMEVTIDAGQATITGSVASGDLKRIASDIVSDCSGISSVRNDLLVIETPPPEDE